MARQLTTLVARMRLAPTLVYFRNRLAMLISRPKWKGLAKQDKLLLELGSGAKRGVDGWTTVDVYGADISHDLRLGIPLPENSVDRIYSSHLLEHIPYQELLRFIDECYRVLKVGGEMSVCVPNAGLYIHAYASGRNFRRPGEGYKAALVDTGSGLDQVNFVAYMAGQHHYMFDEENLVNTVKKSPFSVVELRDFDNSLDMEERRFESVYARAIK